MPGVTERTPKACDAKSLLSSSFRAFVVNEFFPLFPERKWPSLSELGIDRSNYISKQTRQ